jgi:hypothetical protein
MIPISVDIDVLLVIFLTLSPCLRRGRNFHSCPIVKHRKRYSGLYVLLHTDLYSCVQYVIFNLYIHHLCKINNPIHCMSAIDFTISLLANLVAGSARRVVEPVKSNRSYRSSTSGWPSAELLAPLTDLRVGRALSAPFVSLSYHHLQVIQEHALLLSEEEALDQKSERRVTDVWRSASSSTEGANNV